jgi:hypothetical protein
MNAVKEMYNDKKDEKTVSKPDLTVVKNEKAKEDTKYTKEYLNEQMYYFYNNGGPVMDI